MLAPIVTLIAAAAVLLVGWNFQRLHRFASDYNFTGAFQGNRYECSLGGLNEGHGTWCLIGADEYGLYLLPSPKPVRWLWGYPGGRQVFKKSLLIPWTDIGCRTGRVLFKDCIWFDLAPRRIYLYVPKDIGEKLLSDAGRKKTPG
jgi:hypothetical protein